MNDFKKIKGYLEKELKEFDQWFKLQLKSDINLLNTVLYYILKRKGKRIRPMLVFLCAKLFSDTNKKTFLAAGLIELLHTATLVHDDVVDDSELRRGVFSIKALWKNKVAVLIGDYLLAKGLLITTEHEAFDLLKITSETVKKMSEGELLQIEKSRTLDIDEATYFDIIHKKTASLIAACCKSGGISTGASKEEVNLLEKLGTYIGLAFQLRDDTFDYTSSKKTGKPSGIDLAEKKLNLPLIYALKNASLLEKRKVLKLIKKKKHLASIVAFIEKNNGFDYVEKKILLFKEKALDILKQLPNNESNKNLKILINYVTIRKN